MRSRKEKSKLKADAIYNMYKDLSPNQTGETTS